MQPDLNKQIESFPQGNIEALGREIEKVKHENPQKAVNEHELIKESLRVFHATPAPHGNASPTTDHDEQELLPDYMKSETEDVKDEVEGLLHVAIEKGIPASIAEAKRHGAYMVDALHDALTDKLYPILKEKHLI